MLRFLLIAVLSMSIGAFEAWAACGPSTFNRGINDQCYLTDDCGWFTWCIWMGCYLNGSMYCFPPGFVNECIIGGCYNALQGNCSGQC